MSPQSSTALEERTEPVQRDSRLGLALFFCVTILLAAAPVLAGLAQRLANSWQPQGDDAAIAWLSHDVFTSHSPLVGMPSTIGGPGTARAHHWGPLLFWVLAVPQKLASDNPVGLHIGLLLLELAAITGAAVFTYRRLGRLATLTLLVLLGLVTWSLGRQVFSSIWNPNIALLPLVAVFVLVWSVADGDDVALPFLVFAASFVVQCNVLYTPLVAALLAWAVVGLALTRRERRRAETGPDRARFRRTLIVSAGVLVFCWSAPIIQELTNRPGNIELVLRNGSAEQGPHAGLGRALSITANTIGIRPLWSHPISSLEDIFASAATPGIVTTLTALAIVLTIVGGLILTWRRESVLRSLLGTALVGLVGLPLIVSRLPYAFGIAPYRLLSAWVVGMFVWFAFVIVVARWVSRHAVQSAAPATRAAIVRACACVLSALLVVVAVLGAQGQTPRAIREPDSSDAVARLVTSARRSIPKPGPFLAFHTTLGIGTGVLWGLKREGYDIRVTEASAPFDGPYFASGNGPGDRNLPHLTLVDAPTLPPPTAGRRLIAATTVKAPPEQVRRLARLRADACRQLRTHPAVITPEGRQLLANRPNDPAVEPDLAALARYSAGASPCELLDAASRLQSKGAISLDGPLAFLLPAIDTQKAAAAAHTYALYVGPQ